MHDRIDAPIAEVRQAFDEERALAEIREQLERGDDAQREKQNAQIHAGNVLIEARKAMPDECGARGGTTYSSAFVDFIKRTGLSRSVAQQYMGFARNPHRWERQMSKRKTLGGPAGIYRRKTLTEIRDALLESTREEVLLAINTELANAKAPFVI